MRREDLRRLFARARDLCGETDYVVFGSLAVLGYAGEVPPRMAASLDVDAFSKGDPGRIFDLAPALGQGSPFESEHGYYLDPISPQRGHLAGGLAGSPDAHPARAGPRGVVPRAERRGGVEVRADGAPRPGVDPPRTAGGSAVHRLLDARFAQTTFLDAHESDRARKALEEDRRWLRAKRARRR